MTDDHCLTGNNAMQSFKFQRCFVFLESEKLVTSILACILMVVMSQVTLIDYAKYKAVDNIFLFFSARIVIVSNNLPNSVVDACTVNAFKARLSKFWQHQSVKFDFISDLTGTGNRSEEVIK